MLESGKNFCAYRDIEVDPKRDDLLSRISKTERVYIEKPSSLEEDLYKSVEHFFQNEKNCDKTGSSISEPLMLKIFGGSIYPDVYGISNPGKVNFQVYMAEGKRGFGGRNFDECKGQAITLQRFADLVYLFFPRSSWNELDKDEQSDVEKECRNLKLGLLLVDKDACKERIHPSTSPDLLKEENRTLAKDKIAQYFPDFAGPQENADFYSRYTHLADSMTRECCGLIDDLAGSFRKTTRIKKQSIKPWYKGDRFEFYFYKRLKKSDVSLAIRPFGDEEFETHYPILMVEEIFRSSILKSMIKEDIVRNKMLRHFDECLKKKCIVWAYGKNESYIYLSDEKTNEMFSHIKQHNLTEELRIYEQIEILGVEKKKIKKQVEETLQRIIDFSDSLKSSKTRK